MHKFAAQEADLILAGLDKLAEDVQANYETAGLSFDDAKAKVNAIDKLADDIEIATFGKESFVKRRAEVIQKDSDEKYMGTFANPMAPVQVESDEPYMAAYKDDQSSAVIHGKSTTGAPLAAGH